MSTKRTSISLLESLYLAGVARQKAKHFANFSDYVEDLIRRDVISGGEPRTAEMPPSGKRVA